jgi:hypothetical protein
VEAEPPGRVGESMSEERRQRLAVKLFRVIDGEAEGRFAISVLLIMVVGVVLACRFF